jgi:hypothetical protein
MAFRIGFSPFAALVAIVVPGLGLQDEVFRVDPNAGSTD